MFKAGKIVIHIAALYGLFIIGNWIQETFNLFIPGSVIGMIILFLLLITRTIKVSWIEDGTRLFVKHLTLFFIPAMVGIISFTELFSWKGLQVVVIVLVSTALVMGISAFVSQWLLRKRELEHE